MAVQHFDLSSFEETISSGTTLVDFWATWCGPCRMQAPIIDAFDAEMGETVKVGKVDVDEQPAIAQRYGIASIPTLILFRDGQEVSRSIGVTDLDGLKSMVNS
ncbi:MAG: thioredoxin [Oscillospiraceae bacterium]|nr:thioredoxin [Oscillospiraceae bacterium]MBP1554707.1 thioredoxin [Oscillospiraceae bacterium]MBQ5341140.1 thioredoxin [Oscillospiraceae bacterium]MBQ5343557.1 thioredoxin [Oscillospiraceae bacterium]